MSYRLLASLLVRSLWVLSVVAACGLAQAPPGPQPTAAELPFLRAAGKKLDAYATLCFKNGYPRKARVTWLEVIAEYDADNESARAQLGFVRQGTVWQRQPDFDYPAQDNPSAAVAKNLEQKWDALCKDLGEGHRNLAAQLATAGNQERAGYHFARALRFLPGDAKAQTGAGVEKVDGVVGNQLELQMLKRSRMMDQAIQKQVETRYKVEPAELKEPHLDKSSVPYVAVRSEHFVVYGDFDPAVLSQAAEWSERALAFCQEAFAGEPWQKRSSVTRQYAYFQKRDTWKQVVEANRSSFHDPDFILQNTKACTIGSGRTGLYLGGMEEETVVYDYAVRKVVHDYALLSTDGMVEGIGHAVVGMFFGRNLIVLVGPASLQGTVSGRDQQKYTLPDVDTWKQLATELAFADDGIRAARLPLIKASAFTNQARIKAWSFCDYLLRADPKLLVELDSASAKARNENDVEADFQKRAGTSLAGLEDGWRRYWTDASPVRRAIDDKASAMQAASKDAPAWLEQFNRQRAEWQLPPVGWSADLSIDCKAHADYLKQNKAERGPDKEHTEVPGKTGFSNAGRTFASTALVWTRDKDPKKAMERWLDLPGYRDALFNGNIDTIGVYADGGVMVMDVLRGRAPSTQSTMRTYPVADLADSRMKDPVPAAVDVELLGSDVLELLQKNGRGKQKQIGYPLTLHFYDGDPGEVQCQLTCDGKPVAGELQKSQGGHSRRTAAPGMWVFFPYEPLERGKDLELHWSWRGGNSKVVFKAR